MPSEYGDNLERRLLGTVLFVVTVVMCFDYFARIVNQYSNQLLLLQMGEFFRKMPSKMNKFANLMT
jgi:hypothetical protein